MAAQTLRLGPSYPSTALMPTPNTWKKKRLKRAVVNETADGSAYLHHFAFRYQWVGTWEKIVNADMALLLAEYNRTRSLALIDFDSSSYTVLAEPDSYSVEMEPGTSPPLWNVMIAFRQATN